MRRLFEYISLYVALGTLLLLAPFVCAQNGTSSPFSRYAYGDLNDNVSNTYRAMGGVGIGMRSNKVICAAQPASYTACDSLTFMFDLAASVMWSRYADASGLRNKANGNLEYLTMQFPLWRRYIAMSLGVLPYSSVGYDIVQSDSIGSAYHYQKTYTGAGGISEVYAGLSFNICNWVALGANVYYMFGETKNTRTLTFSEASLSSTSQESVFKVSSVRLRYGMQLFHTFGDHSFAVGGIFENKQKLRGTYTVSETTSADTIARSDTGFELPMVYGGGVSYSWAKRLTVAFDYQNQCMSKVLYRGMMGDLKDRNRYSLGLEYRNNPSGRRYVDRMLWRFGFSLTDSYSASIGAKDITAAIGVGFPLRTSATVFNATLEYGHRGGGYDGALVENSLRLTINASISENWFFKRKL